MGYAKRTDSGHAQIVKALRKVGCQVKDTSRLGDDFPDLCVRANVPVSQKHPWGGRIMLIEVKGPRGKLSEGQARFIELWPETVIVRSVQEALEAVGVQV